MLNPNCTFHILAKHRHILGAVTVGSALTFGTHVVNVKVTDACGRSGQQKLSVNVVNMVSRENWRFKARRINYGNVTHFLPCICFFYFVLFTQPPEILNLPSAVDVVESIEHETLLYNLTLRDQSGNDTITCSLSSTLPTGAPFLVKYISGTSSKLIIWYLFFCVCMGFFICLFENIEKLLHEKYWEPNQTVGIEKCICWKDLKECCVLNHSVILTKLFQEKVGSKTKKN